MSTSLKRIKVTTETHLPSLLDDATKEQLILERDGMLFRLKRDGDDDDIAYEPDPVAVRQMLTEVAGSFPDLDVDAEIAAVYEARRLGSRPSDRP